MRLVPHKENVMRIESIRLFVGFAGFIALLGIQGGYENNQLSTVGMLKWMGLIGLILGITFWPWVHRGLSRAMNGLNRFLDEPVVRVPLSSEPRERQAQNQR